MKRKKVEHYLISLPLLPHAGHMHCYLMTTNSREDMENACNRMLKVAEEKFGTQFLPMFVSTGPLTSKYTKIIHSILNKMPEVKETLKTATTYHLTVFIASREDDDRLMAIH